MQLCLPKKADPVPLVSVARSSSLEPEPSSGRWVCQVSGNSQRGQYLACYMGKESMIPMNFPWFFCGCSDCRIPHFNEAKSSFESVATRSFGAVEWMAVPRYVASRGKIVGNYKHHDTHDSSKHIQPHSIPILHKLLPPQLSIHCTLNGPYEFI